MQQLQEFVDSRGIEVRVQREPAILQGVKILGLRSRNGRTYTPEALAKAVGLYEGAKVNVNHPKGDPSGPRDYQDRIGVIRNVAVRPGEGLFADFHFNPKHTLAEQLLWDAEHAPENVGFSHSVQARLVRRGDETVVEDILRVQSVDLVADPATTSGLFEASSASAPEAAADDLFSTLTAERLKQRRPDLVEQFVLESTARLQAELEDLRAAEVRRQRRDRVRQLLREFDLPDPDTDDPWAKTVVSDRFLEQLLSAPDDESIRDLLEERARLIAPTRPPPQSRDQHQLHATTLDAKTFTDAIT